MARYRLTFEVTPAVAIKTELNVALGPEISATFKPQTREDSYGNPVPCGLDGTCSLSAETVDDAVSKGMGIVETLLSIMSLAEGVGIPRARPLVVYDASPNVVDRDFRRYYHPPHSAVSRGTLHIDRFQDLVHSLSEVGDVDLAARVNRAMLWYRGALADVDPLERFARYWLVLETMNPRLREVLASERFRHKCPSCGHTWSYDGIDGVKKLFHTRIRDGDRVYRKANDIRNGLQHGFRSLADLRLEAGEVLPSVREAALKSILVVLGSEDTAQSMLTKEISVITPMTVVFPGRIRGDNPDGLGVEGRGPCFELRNVKEEVLPVENDMIQYGTTADAPPKAGPGVTWVLYAPICLWEGIETFHFWIGQPSHGTQSSGSDKNP